MPYFLQYYKIAGSQSRKKIPYKASRKDIKDK